MTEEKKGHGPGWGVAHPTRKKMRTQFTIRLEEGLEKTAQTRAAEEGVTITAIVERSLWELILRHAPDEAHQVAMRDIRFLWEVLTSQEQETILAALFSTHFLWGALTKQEQQRILKLGLMDAPPALTKTQKGFHKLIAQFFAAYAKSENYRRAVEQLARKRVENRKSEEC